MSFGIPQVCRPWPKPTNVCETCSYFVGIAPSWSTPPAIGRSHQNRRGPRVAPSPRFACSPRAAPTPPIVPGGPRRVERSSTFLQDLHTETSPTGAQAENGPRWPRATASEHGQAEPLSDPANPANLLDGFRKVSTKVAVVPRGGISPPIPSGNDLRANAYGLSSSTPVHHREPWGRPRVPPTSSGGGPVCGEPKPRAHLLPFRARPPHRRRTSTLGFALHSCKWGGSREVSQGRRHARHNDRGERRSPCMFDLIPGFWPSLYMLITCLLLLVPGNVFHASEAACPRGRPEKQCPGMPSLRCHRPVAAATAPLGTHSARYHHTRHARAIKHKPPIEVPMARGRLLSLGTCRSHPAVARPAPQRCHI